MLFFTDMFSKMHSVLFVVELITYKADHGTFYGLRLKNVQENVKSKCGQTIHTLITWTWGKISPWNVGNIEMHHKNGVFFA